MPAKRSKTASGNITPKTLADNLMTAARAYVEGTAGTLLQVKPPEIIQHRATEFDIVIRCVGQPPRQGPISGK